MSLRIYISDSEEGGEHGTKVMQGIINGYGSDISAQINLVKSALYSTAQVKADMLIAFNAGYELFVSSAYGANNFLSEAKTYYSQMLCVFPNGTNVHETNGVYTIPEIAVVTGAGDSVNETGYPIEFFEPDSVTIEPDLSSFSNGVIAGKLLRIKDNRNCNWTEAVQCARATASLVDNLTDEDGYGIIDVDSAIAYTGEIKLSVGSISVQRINGLDIIITLEKIIDATSYKINIINNSGYSETITTTSLTTNYTLPDYGVYTFSYQGLSPEINSHVSATVILPYTFINFLLLVESEMDYGFLITDYDTLFGSYGIITKLNVSDYLVDEILSVQAEKLDLSKSEVVTNNTSYESLCAYQDDENCPSIAWNYSSGILSVFFSNNTYARFSYSGYRFPQKMTLTTTLDANESDLELIKCYTLKDLYADNNMMLPYNIRETIDILEQRLIDAI